MAQVIAVNGGHIEQHFD